MSESIVLNIDNHARHQAFVEIYGWVYSKNTEERVNIIVQDVNQDNVKIIRRLREDVARFYSDHPGALYSGFIIEVADLDPRVKYLTLQFIDPSDKSTTQVTINTVQTKKDDLPTVVRKTLRSLKNRGWRGTLAIIGTIIKDNLTQVKRYIQYYRTADTKKYVRALFERSAKKSQDYIELSESRHEYHEGDVKFIAFYLPQYHPTPENDAWWGRGFTEWTNVTRAVPQFFGHYQPHLPDELGFYDLRLPEVMRRQIDLARQYGIYGFCFYHYWFAGKRLLYRPANQFLDDPSLDMPFCVCWANENWTKRWDGLEHEVLIAQNHSPEDDLAFIKDLERTLRDPRYICIDGRPLLIVYRPNLLPDIAATARRWREYCWSVGIGDLYVAGAQSFGFDDPRDHGLDAAVEFPPHKIILPELSSVIRTLNPNFAGKIYNYRDIIERREYLSEVPYKLYKCAMLGWDNTARKPNSGFIYHGFTPALYKEWLKDLALYTRQRFAVPDRYVFINAWNEWAEGTHLEPDRRYGYALLQATAEVIEETRDLPASG